MFRFLTKRSARTRMDELERFLEFWYGPRRPGYGEPERRLRERPLPYPLRRFYAFAGRWPAPAPSRRGETFYEGHSGHHLQPLDGVKQLPLGRLNFFMAYQGDWDGRTLAKGDDPPVGLALQVSPHALPDGHPVRGQELPLQRLGQPAGGERPPGGVVPPVAAGCRPHLVRGPPPVPVLRRVVLPVAREHPRPRGRRVVPVRGDSPGRGWSAGAAVEGDRRRPRHCSRPATRPTAFPGATPPRVGRLLGFVVRQ